MVCVFAILSTALADSMRPTYAAPPPPPSCEFLSQSHSIPFQSDFIHCFRLAAAKLPIFTHTHTSRKQDANNLYANIDPSSDITRSRILS